MQNQNIDHGNKFDWGKTSADYARFRDIYPPQFYEMILNRGCGTAGQRVLDVGTGTGVLPRNLYAAGAHWTGCDIAPNQIAQAKQLSQGMEIAYLVSTAETLPTFAEPFDWITACQCYWYFDVAKTAPAFARVLKSGGKVLLLCMQWLPYEDPIAHASEELVLQYNPNWSGAGERKHPIAIAEEWLDDFTVTHQMECDLDVPFTRESWNGRIKACRGIGASLPPEEIAAWEAEHLQLLERIAPESFSVRHYAALAELTKKSKRKSNKIVKKVLTNGKNHVIIKKNPKKKEEGLTWHKNKHVPNKLQITVLFGTLILYWKILKQALLCREMK